MDDRRAGKSDKRIARYRRDYLTESDRRDGVALENRRLLGRGERREKETRSNRSRPWLSIQLFRPLATRSVLDRARTKQQGGQRRRGGRSDRTRHETRSPLYSIGFVVSLRTCTCVACTDASTRPSSSMNESSSSSSSLLLLLLLL